MSPEKNAEIHSASLLFYKVELEKANIMEKTKYHNEEFSDFIQSAENKIEKAEQLADSIRNESNYNTYSSSSLKKKGGAYGLLHEPTGLFTVSE